MATGGDKPPQDEDAGTSGTRAAAGGSGTAGATRPKRAASGTRAKTGARKPASAKPDAAKPGAPMARKPARGRSTGGRAAAAASTAEQVARSYFAALSARDAAAMAGHWSAEGVDDIVPFGVLRGPDEVRSFFEAQFAAIPDLETTVDRVVADEHSASVQWRMRGTFSGAPFQGIEPTGKWLELRGVDVVEVEDGKIVRNSAYYDAMTFAREIGMLPSRDSQAERAMFAAFNAVTKVRERIAARQR